MRVFVSSVVSGYEAYGDGASRAITALGHDPVLMERGPAVAATPREACLVAVAGSDAVVVLLGTVYGDEQTWVCASRRDNPGRPSGHGLRG